VFPARPPVRLQHRHAERREVLLALAPRFIARGLLRRPAAGGRLRAARERLALLHVLEQRVDQILLRGVHLPEAPRLVELPVPDELLEFLHGDGRDVGVFFGGEQVRLAQRLAQHLEVLALRELLEVLRHLQRTSCGFLEHGCWRLPSPGSFFFGASVRGLLRPRRLERCGGGCVRAGAAFFRSCGVGKSSRPGRGLLQKTARRFEAEVEARRPSARLRGWRLSGDEAARDGLVHGGRSEIPSGFSRAPRDEPARVARLVLAHVCSLWPAGA